jgi:hypothetical protein
MRSKDLVMKPSRFCMGWLRWRTFGTNRPVCDRLSSSSSRLEIKSGNHEKSWKLTGRRETRIRRENGILGHGGCSNFALSVGGIRDGRNVWNLRKFGW